MPRDITITFEDGTTHVYRGAPDSVTPEQVSARATQEFGKGVASLDGGRKPGLLDTIKQQAGNIVGGALRGAASIGATLTTPVAEYDAQGNKDPRSFLSRRSDTLGQVDAALSAAGADPSSLGYRGGKLASEIAGTAGVGGAVANAVRAAAPAAAATPTIANLLQAIQTSGMSGGSSTGVANALTRSAGGAINGGLSAGLIDPAEAGSGALVGGAMPGVTKLAGEAGRMIGKGASAVGRSIVGDVSPEVAALAQRAKALGIDVPADRLTNSKPLNAVAASLNYVPFSGRAGTEEKMLGGMNRALSRTFGQDSENVTMALRKAAGDLGNQFDAVLKANTVKMTPTFKAALADAENQATSELGSEAASIIHKQIAQIQAKGAAGAIDGQAAYNIKKALDRIGSGNSDAAFYARDLKKKLMDALNESLGPTEAAAFAKVRQQYGNMLSLENLAQNGAEGGVSVGRLANLKHINNPDLQELADIAAQFLRTRENPHGALQRLVIGGAATGAAGGLGALGALPIAAGVGRAANAALNSNALKNAALGVSGQPNALQRLLANSELAQLGYRAAPVLAADR